jgi:hypothetical protein
MLSIHESQMNALNETLEKRFVERVRAGIREIFPDLEQRLGGAAQHQETVAKILAWAEGYGIETDGDLAVFAALTCANFKLSVDKPGYLNWTKAILEREATAGASKVGLIEFLLRDRAANDPVAARLAAICSKMRELLNA